MGSSEDSVLSTMHAPARWAVAMFEPLIEARRLLELEDEARVWSRQNPRIAAAWFAGFIWQIMATLPSDDPWRSLNVKWPLASTCEVLRRGADTPSSHRGATLRGEVFVGPAVGTDIVFPSNADITLDAGLVALRDGIDPASAAVLGLASDSWQAPFQLLSSLEGDSEAATPVFNAACPALRWALWRRRAYIGKSDPYPLLTAFAWLGRAERVASGQAIDSEGCIFEIEAESIDDGAWADMAGMLNGHPFFPTF